MDYENRNTTVAKEVVTLCEAVEYGKVDFSLSIHNRRIASLKVSGRRRYVFNKANQQEAYKTIANRIVQGEKDSRTEELVFVVKRVQGVIKDVEIYTEFDRNYEEIDKANIS